MFTGCLKLTGGNETSYDGVHVDAEYARPDGVDGKDGYFTTVTLEVYTFYKNGVLTYYYDDQRNVRTASPHSMIRTRYALQDITTKSQRQ